MNRAKIGKEHHSIESGDYVIVDSNYPTPATGDYVVSVLDDMANIKKFVDKSEEGLVVLVSESSHPYPPIYLSVNDTPVISGKVIQVVKAVN